MVLHQLPMKVTLQLSADAGWWRRSILQAEGPESLSLLTTISVFEFSLKSGMIRTGRMEENRFGIHGAQE